jgi:hypothetical protein
MFQKMGCVTFQITLYVRVCVHLCIPTV